MKIDEYKAKIDGLLTNPDTALAGIGEVYDALSEDLTTRDSLAEENEALKKTVQELRETNIRLYMQSGSADQAESIDDDVEDEDEKAVDEFFEGLFDEKED